MSRYLFIIHGTWGSRSKWSAPLTHAVRQRVPGVCVEQFQWSGGNRHHDRLVAAQRLAERLRELSAEDVVIIAHSHGGNIARSASALAGKCSGLRLIVSVGTPFITIDQRDGSIGLSSFDKMFDYGFGPWVVWRVATGKRKPKMPKYFAWLYRGLAACSIASGIAAAAGALASTPLRRLAPIDELVSMIDPRETWAELLIVATPGDEASLALAFGQFIGFLSWRSSRSIVVALDRAEGMVVFGGLAYWLGRKMAKTRASSFVDKTPTLRTLERQVQYVYNGLGAFLALPMLLHWIDRLSTGWDGAGISSRETKEDHYTRVTVAPTPRGTYTVKMLPLPTDDPAASLAHTTLLTDPTAVAAISGIVAEAFQPCPSC